MLFTPFDQKIESNTCDMKMIFRTSEQKIRSANQQYFYLVSQRRIEIFLRTVLTIIAALLLLIPVLILFELQPNTQSEVNTRAKWQMGTVFVFTLIFSAICSIFTKARKQEVFSATAAYAAVLVIFLSNTSGNSSLPK